jgi:hypothetical protein
MPKLPQRILSSIHCILSDSTIALTLLDVRHYHSFILKKYQKAYGGKGKLYAHTTCALDKKNCERVFNAVKETLLQQSIKLSGLSV